MSHRYVPVNAGNAIKTSRKDECHDDSKPTKAPSLYDVVSTCTAEGVPGLLCIKFLAGLSGELFQTTLPLALKDDFQLSLADSGYVMSMLGVLSMFGVHQTYDAALLMCHPFNAETGYSCHDVRPVSCCSSWTSYQVASEELFRC